MNNSSCAGTSTGGKAAPHGMPEHGVPVKYSEADRKAVGPVRPYSDRGATLRGFEPWPGEVQPPPPTVLHAEEILRAALFADGWCALPGCIRAELPAELRERIAAAEHLFRMLPELLDPRRIVSLGDYVAANPEKWRAIRMHFFAPELSLRQIAELLHMEPHQVRDAIANCKISDACYDNVPPCPPQH